MYDPELLDLLESFPVDPYGGAAWRITFDGQLPLRPNTRGARWNPADVSALYTSLSLECARAEFQHLLDLQIPLIRKPASEHTLDVRLERVLDLRAREQLTQVGIDVSASSESVESWARFQMVGGAAQLLGYEGLLVPSVRLPDGVNLVIFTDNVQSLGSSDVTLVESHPFVVANRP